jgi:hypothetical protein
MLELKMNLNKSKVVVFGRGGRGMDVRSWEGKRTAEVDEYK